MAGDLIRLPAYLRLGPDLGWPGLTIDALGQDPADPDALANGWPIATVIDPRSGAIKLQAEAGGEGLPLTDPSGSLGGLTLPTGVAIAPDGRVLVVDPDHSRILITPHAPDQPDIGGFADLFAMGTPAAPAANGPEMQGMPPQQMPAPGPHQLLRPRGLVFTSWGDLAVTDSGLTDTDGRLILYAWPSGAARRVIPLPGRPWDIAICPEGGLLVALSASGTVARFDRQLQRVTWLGGAGVLNRPRHLILESGPDLDAPCSCGCRETCMNPGLLVLDDDPATARARLVRLDDLGRATVLDEAAVNALWQGHYPPPFTLDAEGLAHRPADACNRPGPELPGVTLTRRGRLLSGPVLVPVPPQVRRLRKGIWLSAALDGGLPGFQWDRVVFDLDLPDEAALDVETLTSDLNYDPRRLADLDPGLWSVPIRCLAGSRPEVLVQSQPGRYLWLRLTLQGDGLATPALRAIELTGPRRSAMADLPAPFHEDPQSRDFLDRFLSLFDTIRAEIAQGIDNFERLLSPAAAPDAAFLDWLASWFDLRLLASWPMATRRAFVARADAICRSRGTVAGLRDVLQLHLGPTAPAPVLIESFRLRDFSSRRAQGATDLPPQGLALAGLPVWPLAGRMPGEEAHRFILLLPEALVPDSAAMDAIVRLVDLFRPATTDWRLILVPQGVRIGCQSTIGVDMLLGDLPTEPLGEAHLAQSARLTGPPIPLSRAGDTLLRPM